MNDKKVFLKEIKTIGGKNLILRNPKQEDSKKMIEYFNTVGGESENLLFGKNEFSLSIEEEIVYINKINQDENSIMILSILDDQLVGVAQLVSLKRKRIEHNSQLSISVRKEYLGYGIGSLMVNELISFAKKHEKIRNINLTVNAKNERGISLYKKFGFEYIGTHKNSLNIDGQVFDEIIMDLQV